MKYIISLFLWKKMCYNIFMKYNKIIISNKEQKDTIYTYLKRNGYSENYVKNLRKQEGFILLNGKNAHTDFKIKNGDVLETIYSPNPKTSIMQCVIPLDIVYEDEHILVINKPSGLSTSASRSHYTENLTGAIIHYIQDKDENFVVRIINRLDKDTAGLILVAKHSLASKLLNEKTEIKKTYFAICTGEIKEPITINAPIETTLNELGYNNHKRIISLSGKPATTHCTPLIFDGTNTLCRITIEHGRTHQIRVHMSHVGHALLGDELYGKKSTKISHTALVCKELSFIHPFTKQKIELSAQFENEFISAFNKTLSIT